MGLQWVILTGVVAAEALVAALVTLPAPRAVRSRIVALASFLLQPAASVLPFAAFQLLGEFILTPYPSPSWSRLPLTSTVEYLWLDIHWKNEHRLMCTSEICTTEERTRYEKSVRISLS